MCLSIPALVVSLDGSTAVVEVAGNRRRADVGLLADVAVGDYILLHAGFAIGKFDTAEAEETLRLLDEVGRADAPPARQEPRP